MGSHARKAMFDIELSGGMMPVEMEFSSGERELIVVALAGGGREWEVLAYGMKKESDCNISHLLGCYGKMRLSNDSSLARRDVSLGFRFAVWSGNGKCMFWGIW
jgi:hypothetical protein